VGAVSQVFLTGQGNESGTQSHLASILPNKDAVTIFKRTQPTSTNVWLDRHVYSDVKGSLTSSSEPSKDGTGTYSDTIVDTATVNFETDVNYDDSINITSGQNKSQTRDIRTVISSSSIGTRHNTPRTILDYNADDQYQIVKNLEISYDDNLVAILDNDSIAKTVDISFSRTGRVNDGSQSLTFIPTNLAFSADDSDNESGIDFGTLSVWGTLASQSSTNFNDYAIWFKARNWYLDNGAAMILRAKEFGPIGDKVRFKTEYPSVPNADKSLTQLTTPESTTVTYTFGSDAAVSMNLAAGDLFTLTSLGSYNFRLTFPSTATTSSINVNDVITIGSTSGFSSANRGTFSIIAKNDTNKTVDIYNPNGIATIVGNPTVQTIQCVADSADSLNGTYFVLQDENGSTVKFWYDNNNGGTVEPAIGTTDRSWEINVSTGDSAITVATATAAVILNDSAFALATNISGTSSTITVTSANNGPSVVGVNGSVSSGFSFAITTPGISDTYEVLNVVSQIQAYPIKDNSTSTIVEEINSSSMLEAAVQTPGTLYKATKDIVGVAINEVAYNHDSDPTSGNNSYVSLWDSKNWVLSFQNANPNFQLKQPMVLSGVSSVYQLDTAVNTDGSQGELFKLVPVTLNNLKHHVTHKALSQLDIVSDLAFANNNKKLQIKSQQLGSNGAIEIVGGRANGASFKVIGDSQVTSSSGNDYLELKIPASPNTLSPGQHVLLSNDSGVERLNRMISTDTMDVVKHADGVYDYRYNNKNTNFSQFTKFTISDANAIDPVSYPNSGIVWRWTHDDSGSFAEISDKIAGVVSSLDEPKLYDAAGVAGGSTNLHKEIITSGTLSTALEFTIASSGQPVQGDYIRFKNSAGSTWAAWFSIDGDMTAPIGATYSSASNKVRVDILSSDTPNQVISKLVSALLTGGILAEFDMNQTPNASLSEVRPGNIVNVLGSSSGWSSTNLSSESGTDMVSGLTIVNVDEDNRFIDVVNPSGVTMSSTEMGSCTVIISSTPIIEWRLAHSSRVRINQISILSNIATATTDGPHGLNVGDAFTAIDVSPSASPDTSLVLSIISSNQFTYASTNADSLSVTPTGLLLKSGKSRTRYKIESLGYNKMFRLSRHDGDSPKFVSCGVAVDDLLILSGDTFGSSNNGEFRVLAVDEESMIYQNQNGSERLDTFMPFNNIGLEPSWIANSDTVTGVAGTFSNLNVGDWVKKITDDDTMYVQVSLLNASSSLATVVTLGAPYSGVTGTSPSHALDQNSSIGTGVYLDSMSDMRVLEGDSVRIGDTIFITENINANWFAATNSGEFVIKDLGTIDSSDGRIYLRVDNDAGVEESDVNLGVVNTRFSITENVESKFTSIKQIQHIAIDESNTNRRIVYLSPGDRSYKWNQTNSTSISALGKIDYSENIVSGIDGYQYYTGLLRKVQRIVDGFEPDPASFPGRKAVGSAIEILPPLPVRVSVSLDVTTQDGVNLSEISDEIVSAVINYVSDLGVGEDVILSDIIVRVKSIMGVAAVTFISPSPSNERISISDSEKAFIEPTDISVT